MNTLKSLIAALKTGLGTVLAALWSLLASRLAVSRAWLWLWLLFLVPFVVGSLFTHGWAGTKLVALQAAIGLAAAILLRANRGVVAIGLLSLLLALTSAGVVARWLAARSWSPHNATNVTRAGVNPRGSIDTVTGAGINRVAASRTWRLAPATPDVRLTFDARLVAGDPAWNWRRSDPAFRLEPLTEAGVPFTRIVTPSGGDPYVYRRAELPYPIAGRTFRAGVELRLPQPGAARCGRLYLAEPGAKHVAYLQACPTQSWQPFTLTWQPPPSARQPYLDLNLNDFDTQVLDVRKATLEVLDGDTWRSLAPLLPTGVRVVADWPGRPRDAEPSLRFLPTNEWRSYGLTVRHPSLAEAELLQVRTLFDKRLKVQIKNVRLVSLSARDPAPAISRNRQALWLEHPNLAGHTLTTLGLAGLSSLRSGWPGLLGATLTLLGVALTGSRAAWLAALIGLPALLWLACRAHERRWVFATLGVGATLLLAVVGVESLARWRVFAADVITPRSTIWGLAWRAMQEHPVGGLGPDGFTTYWQTYYQAESAEIVPHAHNLWLALASGYGVPGLVAALWLSGGLLVLGWRWGRGRGVLLVAPVLLMNVFDYTLFYGGVLYPLILGMNALTDRRADTEPEMASLTPQNAHPRNAKMTAWEKTSKGRL